MIMKYEYEAIKKTGDLLCIGVNVLELLCCGKRLAGVSFRGSGVRSLIDNTLTLNLAHHCSYGFALAGIFGQKLLNPRQHLHLQKIKKEIWIWYFKSGTRDPTCRRRNFPPAEKFPGNDGAQ